MEVNIAGWAVIVLLLFITTFGLCTCITLLLTCIAFIAGILTMLYLAYDDKSNRITSADLLDNPLEQTSYTSSLVQVMHIFNEPKKVTKTDKRITGSEPVDSFLHEIFDCIIRDYVTPWYSVITPDKEFIDCIRETAQILAVNVSNRIKSVDWQNYLMGRPVEDIAGQLRLFRGAGGGVQQSPSRFARRGSPGRSPPDNSPQHHRRNKSDTDVASFATSQRSIANSKFYFESRRKSNVSFEQKFFELEREMEKQTVSREKVCTDAEVEICYLTEICQILFYVGMDPKEFSGTSALSIMRAICSVSIQSGINYITDPDTLNTLFLRSICRDGLSSETFLTVIRSSDNMDEVKYTLDLVKKEIQNLVSHDTVGECDISVKQQLSSLQYLVKVLNNRSTILTPASTAQLSIQPPIVTQLPLSFLLDNHLALCYFLDYAQSMGAHAYIFCHLSIQAWRAVAIKHFNLNKESLQSVRSGSITVVKTSAQGIYDQYLGNESKCRVDIPQPMLRNLLVNMSNQLDEKSLMWFQEIEEYIHKKLTAVEIGFKNSRQYTRLLAELDLEILNSTDITEAKGFTDPKYGSFATMDSLGESSGVESDKKSLSNLSDSGSTHSIEILADGHVKHSQKSVNKLQNQDPQKYIQQWINNKESCHLEAVIVETGLVQERGRPFGVYAVEVRRRCPITGQQYRWHVYRRYSDFHELNANIKELFPELGKMEFPSKKTFHNTSRSVLERRMEMLSTWLSTLAALGSPGGPQRYSVLHHTLLLPFLNPKGPDDKQNQRGLDTMFVQPLRQGMRTLRGVPGQLFNTVDDFMGGLSKVLNGNKSDASAILPCQLQTGPVNDREGGQIGTDELPLRVLLLLLDEVFELRKRNQWLRRQIAALLRQLLTAMFADVLNKKVIDFLSSITSPKTIVQCLDVIKRKYWPTGNVPKRSDFRDPAERARARVAVKAVLLSVCQEELKHIIGSETTHRGLMTVFELFQNPVLNKRLAFILIEGIFCILYSEQEMNDAFKRLLVVSQTSKKSHLRVL